VLEHILTHENCDVDPINKLDKATPLHLAVTIEYQKAKEYFVASLLDAGADVTFVPLIPSSPTADIITTRDLDTGYGINTGRQRRTS